MAAAPNVSASATTRRALYSPRFLQQVVDPSSSSTSPASQDELSWLFEAGQFTPATSFSPTSGSNKGGPIAPEYGALHYGVTTRVSFMCNGDATSVTNISVCRSLAELDIGQVFWPTPAAPGTSAPVSAFGKRRREESPIGNQPQKRSRGNHCTQNGS